MRCILKSGGARGGASPPLKWLGSIPFEESLKEQERLKPLAKAGKLCFLGFESLRPVISQGLRSSGEDILWPESRLKAHGLKTIKLRRGGEATLHAPGQLVIYPALALPLLKLKVRDYILCLESLTKEVLRELGIKTERTDKDSGLSTKRGKIAFFGVHISGGVSQHGLSVNVNNDLSLFSAIKSCGQGGRPHDSLALNGIDITAAELFRLWTSRAALFFQDRARRRPAPAGIKTAAPAAR